MRSCGPCTIRQTTTLLVTGATLVIATAVGHAQGLQSADLTRLRNVGQVALSPDGRTVAFTVVMRDQPGRPYGQLWVADIATQRATRLGGDKMHASQALWSPDGQWIAYEGGDAQQSGIWIIHPDGSAATFLVQTEGSNSPLPGQGETIAWAPDSKQIAYVSATPGPETAEATGDPLVFRRYLYRPTASEGFTHYNDNRRLHLFVVDIGTKQSRQLTRGTRDEHSIGWSPDGKEISFVSNYDPASDEFFDYNVFTIRVADGSIRRLTASEFTEYAPVWSPDGKHIAYAGTKRGITDRETTMEDTHVWIMDADGSHRREIGGVIDNRQGHPEWAADGSGVLFTVQERGNVHLVRIPVSPTGVIGQPQVVINDLGAVSSFAAGKGGQIAYALSTTRDMPELYVKPVTGAPRRLTDLNANVLNGKQIAAVDSLTFVEQRQQVGGRGVPREAVGPAGGRSGYVAGEEVPHDRSSCTVGRMDRTVPHSISRTRSTQPMAGRHCTSTIVALQAMGRSSPMRYLAIRTGMKARTCSTP